MEELKPATEESKKEESFSPKEYKLIIDLIKEADEHYNSVKQTLYSMTESEHHLKSEVFEMILPYSKDMIPDLSEKEIKDFLSSYTLDEFKDFYENKNKEELLEVMNTVKDASLVLLSAKQESDEIKKDGSGILKDYFNYMSSDKVKKSREKRLETMKEALKMETDETKKKSIEKMINTIESTLNYSFVLDRFNKYGEDELYNIKLGFFDKSKGSYIISRYRERIKQFGYNEEIFKYFYNIEENFLASKYSPFNNLFLFIYMRMVAYSDPNNKYDKMMVQALTGALSSLVYHKFDNLESEQYFIHIISDVIDKFINSKKCDYVEYFKENNTTYEEHPYRKRFDKEANEKRREVLIDKLKKLKINNYSDDMTLEELEELYNKERELMIKNQIPKKEEEKDLEVSDIEEAEEVQVSENNEEETNE